MFFVNDDSHEAIYIKTYLHLFGRSNVEDVSNKLSFWRDDNISIANQTNYKILTNNTIIEKNHFVEITNYQNDFNELSLNFNALNSKYSKLSELYKSIKEHSVICENSLAFCKENNFHSQNEEISKLKSKINNLEFDKLALEINHSDIISNKLDNEKAKVEFLESEMANVYTENDVIKKQLQDLYVEHRNMKIEQNIKDKLKKINGSYELI